MCVSACICKRCPSPSPSACNSPLSLYPLSASLAQTFPIGVLIPLPARLSSTLIRGTGRSPLLPLLFSRPEKRGTPLSPIPISATSGRELDFSLPPLADCVWYCSCVSDGEWSSYLGSPAARQPYRQGRERHGTAHRSTLGAGSGIPYPPLHHRLEVVAGGEERHCWV